MRFCLQRISLALLLFAGGPVLRADGGKVQLQKQAGPFLITVFSDPSEVRVGRVDLSVLCQKSNDKSTVLDAKVFLHLTKPGGAEIVEFTLPATHEAATNKTLYAAHLDLPSIGNWKVKVDVRRGADEASVSGDLNVLPKEPLLMTYWPFFVIVLLFALLFAINRRLRRGRELRHPRAQR
ncbi:MAG: hypothetical protein ACJ746_23590 [Bryobacteraceae bacterium]